MDYLLLTITNREVTYCELLTYTEVTYCGLSTTHNNKEGGNLLWIIYQWQAVAGKCFTFDKNGIWRLFFLKVYFGSLQCLF